MSRKDKLLVRLNALPDNFTFNEADELLGLLDLKELNKGKTSGSRIMYANSDRSIKILMHRPHGREELLRYQVKELRDKLKQEGII